MASQGTPALIRSLLSLSRENTMIGHRLLRAAKMLEASPANHHDNFNDLKLSVLPSPSPSVLPPVLLIGSQHTNIGSSALVQLLEPEALCVELCPHRLKEYEFRMNSEIAKNDLEHAFRNAKKCGAWVEGIDRTTGETAGYVFFGVQPREWLKIWKYIIFKKPFAWLAEHLFNQKLDRMLGGKREKFPKIQSKIDSFIKKWRCPPAMFDFAILEAQKIYSEIPDKFERIDELGERLARAQRENVVKLASYQPSPWLDVGGYLELCGEPLYLAGRLQKCVIEDRDRLMAVKLEEFVRRVEVQGKEVAKRVDWGYNPDLTSRSMMRSAGGEKMEKLRIEREYKETLKEVKEKGLLDKKTMPLVVCLAGDMHVEGIERWWRRGEEDHKEQEEKDRDFYRGIKLKKTVKWKEYALIQLMY